MAKSVFYDMSPGVVIKFQNLVLVDIVFTRTNFCTLAHCTTRKEGRQKEKKERVGRIGEVIQKYTPDRDQGFIRTVI